MSPVIAAPLGCGVQTGAGTVLNVLRPDAGTSMVVSGAGGVGLSAVMAAVAQGRSVVVVDPVESRRAIAEDLGATASVDPSGNSDVVSKVWLITGSSRGFGLEFATAALGRGDRVVATARNVDALDDLKDTYGEAVLPLALDVTDRSAVAEVITSAIEKFGQLDVVVNNAGYGLFGAVEELSEDDIRAKLETNFFGALWVTQAILLQLRKQQSGHIVQISTIGGVAAFPRLGGYHASKWALEGLTESLAQEVAQFGIRVTPVEPGGFSTDWAGSSAAHAAPLNAYEGLREKMSTNAGRTKSGDPTAAGPALLQIVDAENPPLRVFFGSMPLQMIDGLYAKRLATWKEWEQTSIAADG